MSKVFSTKLDAKVIRMLDLFCKRYHLKKTRVLEEIIREGLRRRMETLELAESLQRGLEDEKEGSLYTADEVEAMIFGKKKAG